MIPDTPTRGTIQLDDVTSDTEVRIETNSQTSKSNSLENSPLISPNNSPQSSQKNSPQPTPETSPKHTPPASPKSIHDEGEGGGKKPRSYGSFDDTEKEQQTSLLIHKDAIRPTPLPRWKMLICCTIQLSEGVVLTQVLPYLPFMVQELMGTDDDTDKLLSTYTGLLAACFAWSAAFTSHFWGNLSDRIGRRPVLWLGLIGNIITIPLFGFSTKLWQAFLFRSLCGLLNGNVGVVRTYVSEIVDKTNRAKGFGLLVLAFNLGFIVGPAIGGPLYGKWGSVPIFKKFPYLLPCIITTMFSVVVLIPAYLKLDETHFPREVYRSLGSVSSLSKSRSKNTTTTGSDSGSNEGLDSIDQDVEERPLLGGPRQRVRRNSTTSQLSEIGPIPINAPSSFTGDPNDKEFVKRELYKNKTFWTISICQAVNAFMIVAEKTVMPLWTKIDFEDGGWQWSADMIGWVQAIGGAGTVLMTSLVFHRVTKRFGFLNVFRAFMIPPILVFILWPLFIRVKTKNLQFLLMLFVELLLGFCQGALFSTTFLLVNACVHPALLGSANGIAQALISFIRGLGPAVGGIAFGAALENELNGGWGTQFPFLNRSMVFFLIAIIAIMNTALSFWIPPRYNDPPDRKETENT